MVKKVLILIKSGIKMWTKKLILFLFVLTYSLLHAQLSYGQGSNESLSVVMYADRISRSYEVRLASALSSYCERGTYEVDVTVNLKSSQGSVSSFGSLSSLSNSSDLSLSDGVVMPGTDGRFLNEFVDDLGGYATQTTIAPSTITSYPPQGSQGGYGIENVVINVMLDNTAYTTEDVSFIEELVRMKAGIDAYRGDVVNVSLVRFTNQKQKMIEEAQRLEEAKKEKEEEERKAAEEEERRKRQEELDAAKNQNQVEPEDEDNFLPYLIVGLVGLLLLVGLFLVFFFMSKKQSAMNANLVQPKVNFPRYDEQFDSLMQEVRELRSINRTSEPARMEIAEYKKLRSFAINKFLAEAKNVGIVLQGWVDSGGDEGIDKASKLIKAIDENLLELLEEKVSHEDFKLLSWNVRNMEDLDTKTKLEALQNFKNAWSTLTASDDKEGDSGMFSFLNSMSVEQIRQALKGEAEGVQALVITQVPADKASEILASYTSEQRSSIMGNMGKLGKIPTSVYKEVSSRLAKEALKMRGMEYVSSDGAGKMLEILETLTTLQQKEFIDEITKADVGVAEQVLKYFISFDDLAELEDKILVKAIQKMDRELLSSALVGVDEVKANEILANVPDRMRDIVKSELIINENKLKPTDIEKARMKMMAIVKKEIREAGGRNIGGNEQQEEEGLGDEY